MRTSNAFLWTSKHLCSGLKSYNKKTHFFLTLNCASDKKNGCWIKERVIQPPSIPVLLMAATSLLHCCHCRSLHVGLMPCAPFVANWNRDYCFHWPQEPSLHKSYPSHTSQNISRAPKAVFIYFFYFFFAYLHSVFFFSFSPLPISFPNFSFPLSYPSDLFYFSISPFSPFFPSVVSSSCQFLSPFFYSFSSFFSIFFCSLSSLFSALSHSMR